MIAWATLLIANIPAVSEWCPSLLRMPIFSQQMHTTFRFARIHENSDWLLPVGICVLLLVWVRFSYLRDARELKTWQCRMLIFLRSLVFFGLLLFYLQPQFQVEREVVTDSRVALVIDTSSSMGSRDEQFPDGSLHVSTPTDSATPKSDRNANSVTRLERLTDWLGRSSLVETLRRKHDVAIYTFDQKIQLIGVRSKIDEGESDENQADLEAWMELPEEVESSESISDDASSANKQPGLSADWLLKLEAHGTQTRLGEMLQKAIEREHRHPIAGIVLMTDGGQNAGPGPEEAVASARGGAVPVHAVGFGAAEPMMNVRVAHVDAPPRAFPDDPFSVRAQIELTGTLSQQSGSEKVLPEAPRQWTIPVELVMRSPKLSNKSESERTDDAPPTPAFDERLIQTKEVVLERDEKVAKIDFEVTPAEKGPRVLIVRAKPPEQDNTATDDQLETDIEIVDRRDRVLLFAGGPSRDYRFLRGQLYRDPSMEIDLYLPWSQAGISQEADHLLDHFPQTRAEMFEYDCLVAFDPAWNTLAPEQIRLLEEWIARQAGGMIVEAGPVFMGDRISGWVANPEMKIIRGLYPVRLFDRTSLWEHRFSADTQPWPLDFTPAGRQADFLWLGDSAAESLATWSRFPGVYSYQSVQGVKPAATLFARSTSPDASASSGEAVYFAEHFYGSGRVFYIGSGELWRLRQIDPALFEQLFTKLIRHVSQGRLLRESDRGTLATDRRFYPLGATATIRATLSDVDLQPLTASEVVLEVITPGGTARTTTLSPDVDVPGNFLGYLPMNEEGVWRLRLTLPESDQQLSRTLRVRMPDLERENSGRNDALLTEITDRTGGTYYPSPEAALDPAWTGPAKSETETTENEEEANLPAVLPDQTRISLQSSPPDRQFERWSMTVFLWVLCGLVLAEWLIRRLLKLA